MSARGRYRQHGRNVPVSVLVLPDSAAWAVCIGATTTGYTLLSDAKEAVLIAGRPRCTFFERRYGKWRRVSWEYVSIAPC